jgi:hypothetical protein
LGRLGPLLGSFSAKIFYHLVDSLNALRVANAARHAGGGQAALYWLRASDVRYSTSVAISPQIAATLNHSPGAALFPV